jgi:serine phosphatase RsbU (regulator of sigma subunit)
VGGSLLGVFTDPPVGTTRLRLGPGDTVVLMTDGILEARQGQDQFDLRRVLGVLTEDMPSADDAVNRLRAAVLGHTGGTLSDDMAAIALRVRRG